MRKSRQRANKMETSRCRLGAKICASAKTWWSPLPSLNMIQIGQNCSGRLQSTCTSYEYSTLTEIQLCEYTAVFKNFSQSSVDPGDGVGGREEMGWGGGGRRWGGGGGRRWGGGVWAVHLYIDPGLLYSFAFANFSDSGADSELLKGMHDSAKSPRK